ncbi:NUDIX hydrolase [Lacticaseibacillus zhaodongensis]|uniref:NUDIX hydrolase n=1 Tax=Lacticaseibacillus zhaodongensis TaxID=2668065 RepID=UPI0012D2CC5A|nr:NUDIX domain-containing protein [Lacticaseibacillus zhaodongensis]
MATIGYIEDLREIIGHRRVILNGSCAVLVNAQNELLMQQRNEPQKRWGLPGGLMELGETTRATVVREVAEECGIRLDPAALTLLNVYADGQMRTAANGDQFDIVNTAYYAEKIEGTPHVNDAESLQYCWIPLDQLPSNIPRNHRQAIEDYLKLKRQK